MQNKMATIMLNNHLSFLKYALGGIILNFLAFSFYLLIIFFSIEPKIAMTITYIFSLIISFFWHKNLTFNNFYILSSHKIYTLVHFSAYIFNLVLLFILVDLLEFNPAYAQGFLIILVAIYLYLMLNRFVFRKKNK